MSSNQEKTSFFAEGVVLRYQELPIPASFSISGSSTKTIADNLVTDAEILPEIFLFSDGQLYFRDITTREPIPLSKLENFYDRIRYVDGELRFYDANLITYVRLNEIATINADVIKQDALQYSVSIPVSITENYNALEIVQSNLDYFTDPTQPSNSIPASELISANSEFLDALNNNIMDATGESVISTLIEHYMKGLSIAVELSASIADFAPAEFCDTSSCTLQNKIIYLDDANVGFNNDISSPPGRLEVANKALNFFESYLISNLYRYEGLGKYIYSIFSGITPTTVTAISGYDISGAPQYGTRTATGYETTPSSTAIFSTLPTVSGYREQFLTEISRSIAYYMYREAILTYRYMFSTYGFVDMSTLIFAPGPPVNLTFHDIFDLVNDRIANYIPYRTTVEAGILNAASAIFSDTPYPILDLRTYQTAYVGGLFDSKYDLPLDLNVLYNTWFDIPDLNFVSQMTTNEVAVSLTANFSVDLTSRESMRFEFRLYDSVTDTELDRVMISTAAGVNLLSVGNIFEDARMSYPVQLNYFGPIPKFVCDTSAFNCGEGTDVKTHYKITRDSCVNNTDIIGEDSSFKNIANRFLDGTIVTEAELFENKNIQTIEPKTPRIFRVQWRMIATDDDGYSNDPFIRFKYCKALESISFTGSTANVMRMNVNIYTMGNTVSGKFLQRGTATFDGTNTRKTVIFDFSTTSLTSEYSVSLQPSKNIKIWYENKTTSGFDIVAERDFEGTVDWIIGQEYNQEVSNANEKVVPSCFVDYKPAVNKSNFTLLRENGYVL